MDRPITISRNPRPFTAGGWESSTISWREFAIQLASPIVGSETFGEYLKAGKKEKTNYKSSAGGYVGGALDNSGLRRKHHMTGRDLVTLDFDHLAPGDDKTVQSMCSLLGCDYVMHSSQSHTSSAPRIRIIIPLSRTITSSNEFAAVSRKLASKIDPTMSKLDKTSHEYERLMFYPRHSKDAQYVYVWGAQARTDVPLCDVDTLLSEYMDWRDSAEWPKAPDNDYPVPMPDEKRMKRDPEERAEPVGSFCSFFTVEDVIANFLSDVYEPVDTDASGRSRYTFIGGSTAAGAIVYDSKFLFSHHDTDPASGKTLNAFELVQLHLFGTLDETANANKDIYEWTDRKSFGAMCEWVQSNQHPELLKYRLDVVKKKGQRFSDFISNLLPTDAVDDFEGVVVDSQEIQWGDGDLNNDGTVKPTIKNMQKILEYDPRLRGRIKRDVIRDQLVIRGNLPWHTGDLREESSLREDRCADENGWRGWSGEADEVGLRAYCEEVYGVPNTKKSVVLDALSYVAQMHLRNGVVEYLDGLTWDGTPRIDTIFIDYLGAVDDPPTREATRKAILGCVYRAYEPGCKFDQMVVLIGPQGVGKSTIIHKLAHDAWFTDSLHTFEGQKVAENIKGSWIVEIGELHALRKAEVGQIRQILASTADRFRLPYQRERTNNPRHCIFFGTGNDPDVVRDPEGERRFWIIETSVNAPVKSVWNDLTDAEIDQIWAEAVMLYRMGESLELSRQSKDALLGRQDDFRDADPWEDSIRQFITSKVPSDWVKWPIQKRLEFWDRFNTDVLGVTETENESCMTGIDGNVVGQLVERDRITAREVWCERLSGANAYSKDASGDRLSKADKKRINVALRALLMKSDEWEYGSVRSKCYGVEKGFKKRVQTE